MVGCGDSVVEDESTSGASVVSHESQYEIFQRLTYDLEQVTTLRKERHDKLAVDELFRDTFTVSKMTEILLAYQDQIERVIVASQDIAPPVPLSPELSEEEDYPDSHMDAAASRLLNNSRLLLADAVRCWSIGDMEACCRRYKASLQIGLCLLEDDFSDHQFRGAQSLYPTIIELDLRVTDGLGSQISPQSRQGLRDLLQHIDTTRMLAWDDESETAMALMRLIRDLG